MHLQRSGVLEQILDQSNVSNLRQRAGSMATTTLSRCKIAHLWIDIGSQCLSTRNSRFPYLAHVVEKARIVFDTHASCSVGSQPSKRSVNAPPVLPGTAECADHSFAQDGPHGPTSSVPHGHAHACKPKAAVFAF